MEKENMFLENLSPFGFQETVERFQKAVQEASWGLIHTHDLQGILESKGFQVEATKVFAICKPPYANKLLSNDDLKIYASLMPCRVAITEKENGKTYVSRMNNGMFAEVIGGDAGDIMGGAYQEVEQIITQALAQ